jgi:3-hydroxyisobutyrate dehydrogenase-like beta-hydroxyacid dehydrogenase
MVKRIGFIGLGAMGTPMARRLVDSGFQLAVFDRLAERTHSLVEFGARGADSPRDACQDAEALIIMVMTASQVEDVLFGDNGVAEALAPRAVVVVMSTIGPDAVRELAERLTAQELRVVDAPVSGGVARAEQGNLLIMAGGQRDLFEELRPVLEAMGSSVVHCGESVGDGQAVKMVNQLLVGVHLAVAGEALSYAAALGLDPRFVFETVQKGAANSFMLENRGERMLSGEFTLTESALSILIKDVDLALKAAEAQGFYAPLASSAHQLYQKASSLGFGGEEDAGIVRVFEQ